MFAKVMARTIMRDASVLDAIIAEVEACFADALKAERAGDKARAAKCLELAIQLEAQAFG